MGEKKQFFVLDIGTRSVIGLFILFEEGEYNCVDYFVKEHDDRAMMDGQIHNIQSVAETVIVIKQYFEKKHGPLQKVFIAAAGRSLRTERIIASMDIRNYPPLTADNIQYLEWQALQKAQSTITNKTHQTEIQTDYTFVGYTPLYYFIDRQPIGSLLHQQGAQASVEIIATFLPKLVITSLEATVQRAGLTIDGLTLEPIACVQTLIPPSLRHLNIAVLDIGAGTSDIAITNEGTITAYGMVPQAGDEVTEFIQQLTLTDFHEAERIKRHLVDHESFTFETLNNTQQHIYSKDLMNRLFPFIEQLAHSLSKKIQQLNNKKSPLALLIIGGGSLTPGIQELLRDQLDLPPHQVMLKTLNSLKHLSFPEELASHPMYVTPFAIAIAANETPLRFVPITINGETERLLKIMTLTVKDVLLTAKYLTRNWYGKIGSPKVITVNKQQMTIPGSHGKPPYIYLNGKKAKLKDVIHAHDEISVVRGMSGEPATIRVSDCVGETENKSIYIHDAKYTIMPLLKVNQVTASTQQLLEDGDHIEYIIPSTITEIFHSLDLTHLLEHVKPFQLIINGKQTIIPPHNGKVICNGNSISLTSHVNHLDRLEIIEQRPLTLLEFIKYKSLQYKVSMTISVNNKEVTLYKQLLHIIREKEKLGEESLIHSGDVLEIIKEEEQARFYFHDVIKFAQVQIPYHGKLQCTLFKNGKKSSLLDEIQEGDSLKIHWSTKNYTLVRKKHITPSTNLNNVPNDSRPY
ncbi:cell division protein FtsA [Cytobacillus kochii]|uniref:cell division protein FtsA n=1 Tax=Cytobacillus kochii TaxID=859143 RepID=UPI00402A7749